ncbi:MAG: SDR family oxidoreductase [Candidatus Dormiibacterota bacterium]
MAADRLSPSLFRLDGQTAIVTGATSGLGERFARVLHGAGAYVVVAGRRTDRLNALVDSLGPDRALAVAADVTDPDAVTALVEAAVRHFGALDVMVNNAGISVPMPAEDESALAFARVVAVNLNAVFSCCAAAARVMLARNIGSIINVASILGLGASWRIPQASYAASKGGVVNLTRELGAQWASRGVRVNAIAPGWFPSEMTQDLFDSERGLRYVERNTPAGRPGRPDELDGALLFLSSRASTYVIGQTIAVDGGWSIV